MTHNCAVVQVAALSCVCICHIGVSVQVLNWVAVLAVASTFCVCCECVFAGVWCVYGCVCLSCHS
jgi:hypothetical protein